MSAMKKGLLLAVVQVAIVASIGAKLEWDRHRLPRAWAKAGSYDPNLPIRGRYLSLQLEVKLENPEESSSASVAARKNGLRFSRGVLRVRDGQLAAKPTGNDEGALLSTSAFGNREQSVVVEPVLFFLPEHAGDPWQESKGGELWAEVSVPNNGPPRPIRLAVKRGDSFTPLEIK
jgi:hypothetical protein